jgi:hypothetical protein
MRMIVLPRDVNGRAGRYLNPDVYGKPRSASVAPITGTPPGRVAPHRPKLASER